MSGLALEGICQGTQVKVKANMHITWSLELFLDLDVQHSID